MTTATTVRRTIETERGAVHHQAQTCSVRISLVPDLLLMPLTNRTLGLALREPGHLHHMTPVHRVASIPLQE
jgi:hypothetical protein